MSLINDMLRDLDRDSEQPKAEPLPSGLAPEKKPASGKGRYLLPCLAAVAVLYLLLVEWNLLGLLPQKKASPLEVPQPVALNSKWLKDGAAAKAAAKSDDVVISTETSNTGSHTSSEIAEPAVAQRQSVPSSINSDPLLSDAGADSHNAVSPSPDMISRSQNRVPVSAETQLVDDSKIMPAGGDVHQAKLQDNESAVQQLLNAAQLALQENRLTTPAGNNAYQFYRSALLLDPHSVTAQAGISSIRARYLAWLDQAIADQRLAAARVYLDRAHGAGVEAEILSPYQARMESIEHTAASGIPEVLEIPTPAAITPAVAPSDYEMAERVRAQGLRSETAVLSWLRAADETEQTTVALADLYASQGRVTELRRLNDVLAKRAQPAFAYVLSQVALLEGNETNAIQHLRTLQLKGAAEQQRMRLLAGLHHKAGDYAAAMQLYSTLVNAAPSDANDWLGLAVSADGAKFPSTALSAYEKVVQLRHSDPRVIQYARQRQQDLSVTSKSR